MKVLQGVFIIWRQLNLLFVRHTSCSIYNLGISSLKGINVIAKLVPGEFLNCNSYAVSYSSLSNGWKPFIVKRLIEKFA